MDKKDLERIEFKKTKILGQEIITEVVIPLDIAKKYRPTDRCSNRPSELEILCEVSNN